MDYSQNTTLLTILKQIADALSKIADAADVTVAERRRHLKAALRAAEDMGPM